MQILGNSVYIAPHCEGNFSKINISEFANVSNLNGFNAMNDGKRLSIFMMMQNKIDDVAQVAENMKNLIAGTYPILKKKFS